MLLSADFPGQLGRQDDPGFGEIFRVTDLVDFKRQVARFGVREIEVFGLVRHQFERLAKGSVHVALVEL